MSNTKEDLLTTGILKFLANKPLDPSRDLDQGKLYSETRVYSIGKLASLFPPRKIETRLLDRTDQTSQIAPNPYQKSTVREIYSRLPALDKRGLIEFRETGKGTTLCFITREGASAINDDYLIHAFDNSKTALDVAQEIGMQAMSHQQGIRKSREAKSQPLASL